MHKLTAVIGPQPLFSGDHASWLEVAPSEAQFKCHSRRAGAG